MRFMARVDALRQGVCLYLAGNPRAKVGNLKQRAKYVAGMGWERKGYQISQCTRVCTISSCFGGTAASALR